MNPQANTINSCQALPAPIMPGIVLTPRKKEYPTCSSCGLFFSKQSDLKNHLEREEWDQYETELQKTSFKCEECCMFFKTKQGFMQHNGKVHVKKYKYSKCQVCLKKFRNKYAVKFHIKQVHSKSTREECPNCGKKFYNKYLVPKHLEKCLGI